MATLIQVKDTKRIDIYHELDTGNVLIELKDDEGTIVNRLTIPNNNVFSVLRGLISDRQRFHRKHVKKLLKG